MPRQGVLIIPPAPPAPGAAPLGRGAAVVPFLMLCVSVAAEPANAEAGVTRLTLANGLRATIYTADYLRRRMTTDAGKSSLRLDDSRVVRVITDIGDPSIPNKGDGRFHPVPLARVVAALRSLEHGAMDMSVTLYLLPYPRSGTPTSSTVGSELFLSPHVMPIDGATCAYIVAHEMGHAFHNHFLSDDERRWDRYRRLRGIVDLYKFSEHATHPNRPKEIFAEDFRVLFGGPEARFGGFIENADLSRPELVDGLDDFMREVARPGITRAFFEGSAP